MFNMGMTEMIIIGAIALIIVGPKKMPDLARAIGKGITAFRKATTEFKNSVVNEVDGVAGPEVKELADMANKLKMQNSPKNIEDYLEKAADALEDAGSEKEKEGVKEEITTNRDSNPSDKIEKS